MTESDELRQLCAALANALMDTGQWWNYTHLISKTQELLKMPKKQTPLQKLSLPVRIENALMRNNIETVEQLERLSDSQIGLIRGLGIGSVALIRQALRNALD